MLHTSDDDANVVFSTNFFWRSRYDICSFKLVFEIYWMFIVNWTLHLSWTNDYFSLLLFLGLPTARGTLIAVISTYIILIILNVVISKQGSDTRDFLRSRDKSMDRVSRYWIASKERLVSMYYSVSTNSTTPLHWWYVDF